jgi:hypothetical protein
MLFSIRINEKLDLSKFCKQANYYIASMDEVIYNIYLPDFKIIAEIVAGACGNTEHLLTMYLMEVFRDQDNEIKSESFITPHLDTRFKESKIIQTLFTGVHGHKAIIQSSSVAKTVENISLIIKLMHKINGLKVFV